MTDVIPMPRRREPELEPWDVSASEVAEFFGVNVETVYRMDADELPFIRVRGRLRRYRWSDVRAYAERMLA